MIEDYKAVNLESLVANSEIKIHEIFNNKKHKKCLFLKIFSIFRFSFALEYIAQSFLPL